MFGLDMKEYLTTGQYLNVEEQLVLQTSLPGLQMDNRFRSVSFLGKILCSDGQFYYVALGRGKDYIRNKMFFYSLDCQSWQLLFPPSADDLRDFRFTKNRFTGDPTHVHRFHLGDKKVSLREETRLSATVHLLDWETDIGPKGVLEIDPVTGMVRLNRHFAGVEDPGLLGSYVHYRLPKDRVTFAAVGEFLEPVSNDYPPGCWILREEDSVVRLHSLWWPGHTFYYRKTDGVTFGSLYIGLGDRNDDLPFMLS